MLPRTRVAAACSAALVLVTVCALVVLRGTTSAQPGAVTAPARAELPTPSCDDGCRFARQGNGYIIGTAPDYNGDCSTTAGTIASASRPTFPS